MLLQFQFLDDHWPKEGQEVGGARKAESCKRPFALFFFCNLLSMANDDRVSGTVLKVDEKSAGRKITRNDLLSDGCSSENVPSLQHDDLLACLGEISGLTRLRLLKLSASLLPYRNNEETKRSKLMGVYRSDNTGVCYVENIVGFLTAVSPLCPPPTMMAS